MAKPTKEDTTTWMDLGQALSFATILFLGIGLGLDSLNSTHGNSQLRNGGEVTTIDVGIVAAFFACYALGVWGSRPLNALLGLIIVAFSFIYLWQFVPVSSDWYNVAARMLGTAVVLGITYWTLHRINQRKWEDSITA